MTSRKNVQKVRIALLAIMSMALLGVVALAPAGASDSAALVLPNGKTTTVEAARLAKFVAHSVEASSNNGPNQVNVPQSTSTTKPPSHKVDICHRTNSVDNPYVLLNVDADSVDMDTGNDHGRGDHNAEHNGPVFDPANPPPPPHNGDQWGDIIPPFFDDGTPGTWPAKNWDAAGQAFFANDCNIPPPPPCPSGTTTITATETVTETVTAEPDNAVPATAIEPSCTVTTTTTVTETTTVPPPPECPGGTVTQTVTSTAPPVTETVTVTVPAQALSANEYTYTTEPPVVTCTVTETTVTTPTETTTVTTTTQPPCEENCTTTTQPPCEENCTTTTQPPCEENCTTTGTSTPIVRPTTVEPTTDPPVAPTTVSPGGTAFTGVENVVPLGAIALMLLTSGSGLLWAGSRRKRDQDQDKE